MISLLFPANVRTKNDHETSVMCTDVFHKKLSKSHYYDDLFLWKMTLNWQKKPSDNSDFDETVLDGSRIFDYYNWKVQKWPQKKTASMENRHKFR